MLALFGPFCKTARKARSDIALGAYTRARHRVFAGKERLTLALQLLIGHRRVANLAAHVLARRPGLLDVVLGAIGDFVPPGALLRRRTLRA